MTGIDSLLLLLRRSPVDVATTLYNRLRRAGRQLQVATHTGDTPYEFGHALVARFLDITADRRGGDLLPPAEDEVPVLIDLYVRAWYSPHVIERAERRAAVWAWWKLQWRFSFARLWRRQRVRLPARLGDPYRKARRCRTIVQSFSPGDGAYTSPGVIGCQSYCVRVRRYRRFNIHRRAFDAWFGTAITQVLFDLITDFRIVGEENSRRKGRCWSSPHSALSIPWRWVRIAPGRLSSSRFSYSQCASVNQLGAGAVGVLPCFSRQPLDAGLTCADAVLRQRGILGVFPEGTSAAAVLRPARPGVALIAARAGARILPVGLDGFIDVLPRLGKGRRARVTAHIGKPFGPFAVPGRGRERREYLERIGHEIMQHIAELLPAERRGHYSDDPASGRQRKETEY